jgi:hypothetical protein
MRFVSSAHGLQIRTTKKSDAHRCDEDPQIGEHVLQSCVLHEEHRYLLGATGQYHNTAKLLGTTDGMYASLPFSGIRGFLEN